MLARVLQAAVKTVISSLLKIPYLHLVSPLGTNYVMTVSHQRKNILRYVPGKEIALV